MNLPDIRLMGFWIGDCWFGGLLILLLLLFWKTFDDGDERLGFGRGWRCNMLRSALNCSAGTLLDEFRSGLWSEFKSRSLLTLLTLLTLFTLLNRLARPAGLLNSCWAMLFICWFVDGCWNRLLAVRVNCWARLSFSPILFKKLLRCLGEQLSLVIGDRMRLPLFKLLLKLINCWLLDRLLDRLFSSKSCWPLLHCSQCSRNWGNSLGLNSRLHDPQVSRFSDNLLLRSKDANRFSSSGGIEFCRFCSSSQAIRDREREKSN